MGDVRSEIFGGVDTSLEAGNMLVLEKEFGGE